MFEKICSQYRQCNFVGILGLVNRSPGVNSRQHDSIKPFELRAGGMQLRHIIMAALAFSMT